MNKLMISVGLKFGPRPDTTSSPSSQNGPAGPCQQHVACARWAQSPRTLPPTASRPHSTQWSRIEEGDTGVCRAWWWPENLTREDAQWRGDLVAEKQWCPDDSGGSDGRQRRWRGPIARVGQGGERCGTNQDREVRGWSAQWRGSGGGVSPKSGESSGTLATCGGQGVKGRVEATLAQVLVEEKAQGRKGDGGGRVPPFIEVGDIEKKGGSAYGHVEARVEGDPDWRQAGGATGAR
jgi:hypothetical protein